MTSERYSRFADFYPFYLSEHSNRTNRRLHAIGSALVLAILIWVLISQNFYLILLALIPGYGFAWVGHLLFEHNRPATFTYPVYSFMGDWVMFRDILIGRIKF